MTKGEIFLYRQNMLIDLKHFFFPVHPLRQSDGYLLMKWTELLTMPLFSVYHNPASSFMHAHDKLKKFFRVLGAYLLDHGSRGCSLSFYTQTKWCQLSTF